MGLDILINCQPPLAQGISMASRAKEDYLKAIYELEEKFGIAKTTPLAKKLGVRAATVTEMVQRMAKETPRVITYKHHQGVRLTPVGRKEALGIVRRHRLLETFLHQTLGLSWDEVHQEAEVLEHHLSPRVTEAIDRHLNFPKFDPHGEPIPDMGGNMADQFQTPLSEIEEGSRFRVMCVDPVSEKFLASLNRIGLSLHTTGRLIARSALDGSMTVEIDGRDGRTCALERRTAGHIYVDSF